MDRKYSYLLFLAGIPASDLVAQAFAELSINDVHARVYSNGLMGPDLATGNSAFIVPAGSGLSPLYSSGLWLGGFSPDNQLKFAAHLFGDSGDRDFFPGPLTIDGAATIDATVSAQYDRVWSILQSDIVQHRAYFECVTTPGCDTLIEFPGGYIVPASLLEWPAEGNVDAGQAAYLAPFVDYNGDGHYDPYNGDYPCVPGDQALYTIFNDKLSIHTQSGGGSIGVEVHMMPFAYNSNPALDHTVFVHYKLINRSTQTLTDFRIGHFADFDLGCGDDDVVGTDVGRNLVYVANGTDNDADCLGQSGYGVQPPAFGMVVIKGPLLEPDALDNTTDPAIPAFNGHGFNDGIIDNERHGLSSSMYFLRNGPSNMTDPVLPIHYYNQLRSIWKDNSPLTHGGSGNTTDPNAVPTLFAFPSDTDPLALGTGGVPQPTWTPQVDLGAGLVDPRAVASMGPGTLEPGEHISLLVAYVYARAGSGSAQASVAALQQRVDSIQAFVQTIPDLFLIGEQEQLPCAELVTSVGEARADGHGLHLFPNPVSDRLSLDTRRLANGSVLHVLDVHGRLVAQFISTGTLTHFTVSQLPSGLYTVRVLDSQFPLAARFIKE